MGQAASRYISAGMSVALFVLLSGCLTPVRALVKQQREEATHYDGPRCPMYPSCSAWADRALEEQGLYGFLLTVDRLFFRETGALHEKYSVTPPSLSRARRYYDPLEDSLGTSKPDLFSESFSSDFRSSDYMPSGAMPLDSTPLDSLEDRR